MKDVSISRSQYQWLGREEGLDKIRSIAFKIMRVSAIARELRIPRETFQFLVLENEIIRDTIMEGELDRFINEKNRSEYIREQHRLTELKLETDQDKMVTNNTLRTEVIYYERFIREFHMYSLSIKEEKRQEVQELNANPKDCLRLKAMEILNKKLGRESNDMTWSKESYKQLGSK